MPFFCGTCDKQVTEVKVNGYDFGDRLLEDVWFIVTLDGDTAVDVRVDPDAAEYFADLNRDKWLKEAKKYVTDEGFAHCTKDDDQVVKWDTYEEFRKANPK